ncbi:uncharacterized protein PRCAT00002534001 [Priceomyces carsonii]|uniref:uncharacterized protein n=1 Tax=Priceomyces carsonii TaxID=28549 RepID=UPI002ED79347|nr:unnamed protein product [Priceomyces carsonii]
MELQGDTYNIPQEDFFEVIIVGGGTCGLAIATRLCEKLAGAIYTEDEHQRFHWLKGRQNRVNLINKNISSNRSFQSPDKRRTYSLSKTFLPEDILVIDKVSNRFMGQWDNQFSSCQIPFLRSPMFFHPDPANVDGLVSFAHEKGKEGPEFLREIDNVVGKEYSKHQMKKRRSKRKGLSKVPVPSNGNTHDKEGLIDINMRDWKDYYRPSTSLFKSFCVDLIEKYNLNLRIQKGEVIEMSYRNINVIGTEQSGTGFIIKTSSGKIYGCKICIAAHGHEGEINYPAHFGDPRFPEGSCHTTHIFSREVNFPNERLLLKVKIKEPTNLVIVGGGLTSAQLVDVAIKSGVQQVYLILRGPLKIKHFDFHLDWVTKYKNVKKSAFYIRESDEERFEMIQNARQGGSVNPEYYNILKSYVKKGRLKIFDHTLIETQNWDDNNKVWHLGLRTNVKSKWNPEPVRNYYELSSMDYIVYATGIKANIECLPLFKNILKEYEIPIVEGFPCLTDNLQWNNVIPLYILGKYASLKIGPSSANLDGARLGAERIGWLLQELKSQGKFIWEPKAFECTDDVSHIKACKNKSDPLSAFETRLRLATGEIGWFSLLLEK